MKTRLDGRVAIVTGGSAGIGPPTCRRLAEAGAAVAVVGRSQERVDVLAASVAEASGVRAIGVRADVRDESDVEAMVARALDEWGRIDVLVASAGILRPKSATTLKPMSKMTTDEWDEVLDTNLRGIFFCNRAVVPTMIRQRSGHIINLSSTSGRKGHAFDTAYCASKFGVIGLTESLAEEVQPYGVKVEAFLPGATDTDMWEQNGPFRRPEYALAPERVADWIVSSVAAPSDTVLPSVMMQATAKPAASGWRDKTGMVNR